MSKNRLVVMMSCAALALCAAVQAQTLYRYQDADGHTVYSDTPPPADARNVQPKQFSDNVIDTDKAPFATRQAMARFPVTLYTFDCDVCRNAQAMLVKRGVPFTTVIVSEEKGAARLKALTGEQTAPVLQVGDKLVAKGYNESAWQAMLDEAGYPKDAPALRAAPARPPANKGAAAPAQPAATPDQAGGKGRRV